MKRIKSVLTGLVCLLIFSSKSFAQPNAQFTASIVEGCAPLVVNFIDQSTGSPTSWLWDLGNGSGSSIQNPSATYITPGTYNIKLTVTNAAGTNSITKNAYIIVRATPSINFTTNQTEGCAPLPISFTSNFQSGGGSLSTVNWDFGDGNISQVLNPTHTYTTSGNFGVTITLENSFGCSKTQVFPNHIKVYNTPVANFTTNSFNPCSLPINIVFNNTTTGGTGNTYFWDFGDGSTSSQQSPAHNYISAGDFDVKLIVTSSNGCKDTLVRQSAVSIGNTDANFTMPTTVCSGSPVLIQYSNSALPDVVNWSFGDGNIATGPIVSHTFNTPGTYNVALTALFTGCTKTKIKQITVVPAANANFISPNPKACTAPAAIQFTNQSTDATSYEWFFGDGTTSTNNSPIHTYSSLGTYSVTLVAHSAGCSDTIKRNGYVRLANPVLSLVGAPVMGCAPYTHSFSLSLNSTDPIVSYGWDFGNGITSNLPNPVQTYNNPGSYPLTAWVTTQSGCRDTVRLDSAVRIGTPFNINFNASPLVACAKEPINFHDLSTGLSADTTVVDWDWDFGDGTHMYNQNPTYLYNDTGKFDIKLVINNSGCIDSSVRLQYIRILPPIAKFVIEPSCATNLNFHFQNNSIGADSWNWDFGDGNTSTDWEPTHTFATPGIYNVKLTVFNDSTQCDHSHTETVTAFHTNYDFTASQTDACQSISPIKFNITNFDLAYVDTIVWDLGNGIRKIGDSLIYTYPQEGVYTVKMIVKTTNGCKDSISKQQFIKIHKPTAKFSLNPTTRCKNSLVNFLDSSYAIPGDTVVQWTWNFGNGVVQTFDQPPFAQTYTDTGTYSLQLIVKDNFGCLDTLNRLHYLKIVGVKANFENDSLICKNTPLSFDNNSTGAQLSYVWHFGDNTTSTVANPSHTYTNDGFYNVMLAIKDFYGCRDTLIKENAVHVNVPIADFTMSDSVSTCPPMVVNFTNNSQNYQSLIWDFGDSNPSNLINPSHTFYNPGAYDVKLIVNGYGANCNAQIIKRITVGGPSGTLEYPPPSRCVSFDVPFTVHANPINVNILYDFQDGNVLNTTDSSVVHTYSTPGHYLPRAILTDQNGCTVIVLGQDTIHAWGMKAVFNINDSVFCDRGITNFIDSSYGTGIVQTYNWNFGDGSPINHEANPQHIYTTPGVYDVTLDIITFRGCKDTLTKPAQIVVKRSPYIEQQPDTAFCIPHTFFVAGALEQTDTSQVQWAWQLPNGQVSNGQSPGNITLSNPGTYTIRAITTTDYNCKDTMAFDIIMHPLPSVKIQGQSYVCRGDSIQLSATGATTYAWQNNGLLTCFDCANPFVFPANDTTFFVVGTDDNGCKKADSINVAVQQPFNIIVTGDQTLCKGQNVTLVATGGDLFHWVSNPGNVSYNTSSIVVSPTQSTQYFLVANDQRQCFARYDTVNVTVYPIPQVDAGPNITVTSGHPAIIIPTISDDATQIHWSPTDGIISTDFPSITVVPQQTTTYSLSATNDGGCMASDQMTVFVICDGSNFFLPNTFTPNGDGQNDLFYPRGVGLFTIRSFKIFDRWGEQVFEKNNFRANDASAGWNGTYKGKRLNDDVYVYYVEIICENDYRIFYKGNIALLR